jgi:hypothetical protein
MSSSMTLKNSTRGSCNELVEYGDVSLSVYDGAGVDNMGMVSLVDFLMDRRRGEGGARPAAGEAEQATEKNGNNDEHMKMGATRTITHIITTTIITNKQTNKRTN